MSPFWMKKHEFGIPFGIDFLFLSKTCKSIELIEKTILWACLSLLKTFFLRLSFHCFFISLYGFPVPIFYEKLDVGAISDFLDFHKGTLSTTFLHKQAPKNARALPTGPLLAANLLFLKPL